MVCYARPAIRMAALVLVAFLVFERPVGHFFDAAALVVAITVAVAVAAVLAALAFTVFLSTRRRRPPGPADACVSCTLRCQHAMTEGPRRLRLVSITDRTPAPPSAPAASPAAVGVRAVVPAGRSLPVVSINGRPSPSSSASPSADHRALVPLPAGPADPQWPDRPARRVPERVGS